MLLIEDDASWQYQAACFGLYHKTGTDLWFAPDNPGGPKEHKGLTGQSKRIRKAREICKRCPVITQCLEFAIENGCVGVWGGTTENERNAIIHSRKEAA